ncbi:hypothetical protein [Anaerosolibacter sp.]|jgi:hypothetical protein|uniref:hypothetical protein n=1 Tax=Anaerosolibacter sp. TaxID=1872527 RepID=UPI002601DA1D|nr:hypothetical protein [Anaerosolibacter sp.]
MGNTWIEGSSGGETRAPTSYTQSSSVFLYNNGFSFFITYLPLKQAFSLIWEKITENYL